ncbi:MAG: chorismate mutase [archaeon]|nr:chorismate mutase [archaeon]
MSEEFLDEKRKEIAAVDRQIMQLVKSRVDLANAIGHYKAEHGLDVRNHAVEVKVAERYRNCAEEFGLDPNFGEILCRIIMQLCVASEDSILEGKP